MGILMNSKVIMDEKRIEHAIIRMSHEIIEQHKDMQSLALIGVRSRGEFIAGRFAGILKQVESITVPLGILDITFYRDDLDRMQQQPEVQKTEINFDVNDKHIVLIDDVLFSGRTVRAAMDALIDLGRPRRIQLAVLVDRGHRELPIKADYVGKNIPTQRQDQIAVHLKEIDGQDEVVLITV